MPSKENFNDYLSFDEKSIFLSVDSIGCPQLYYQDALTTKHPACRDDVLQLTHEGFTLIHKALERGKSAALIKAILDLSTEDILLKTNKDGDTVLHLAVRFQRDDVVEVLLNSPLTNPKVFSKSNFLSGKSIVQFAKDIKSAARKPIQNIDKTYNAHLSAVATRIIGMLSEKEAALKGNSPSITLTPQITSLHEALDILDKKLPYLKENLHLDAAKALKQFLATVRELNYDSEAKETPRFKQGYRSAIEQLYQNKSAMAEINEHRGAKATLTWLVGHFYDVHAAENRDRFFTPHTHTSQVLGMLEKLFTDVGETIPSL